MRRILILTIVACTFSACGIYRPNIVNVPLMKEKGQTQVGATTSTNKEYGLQAGYALTRKFAFTANGNYSKFRSNNHDNVHKFAEAGLGTFKKTKNNNVLEFYFGGGNGITTDSYHDITLNKTIIKEAQYSRFYFQANYGFIMKKAELAFSPRLAYVSYHSIKNENNLIFLVGNENPYYYYKNCRGKYVVAEGAMTLKAI